MNPPGNLRRTLNMLPISPPNFIINILINLARLINPQAPFSPITSYFSIHDPKFFPYSNSISPSSIRLNSLRMRLTQILYYEAFGRKRTLRLRVSRLGGGSVRRSPDATPFPLFVELAAHSSSSLLSFSSPPTSLPEPLAILITRSSSSSSSLSSSSSSSGPTSSSSSAFSAIDTPSPESSSKGPLTVDAPSDADCLLGFLRNLESPLRLFMGEIGPHHRRVPFQYGRVVRHHLHERGGVHRRRRYGPGQRTLRLTAVAPFADAAASHGSARGSCEHASLAPSTKESFIKSIGIFAKH